MAAQVNGVAKKPAAPRAPVRKPGAGKATHSAAKSVHQKASPVQNKAASVAGGENTTSAYAIMASRIANRVAEMAESITLKMLALQNRMLRSSAELSKVEGADEKIIKEHASQSAELSRIIALICAEKARQGA
ncbi:hypothetical protein LTR32_000550 [Rachicladosporium monterosium]|uniref:Uncharacterized protein n=1 Tax=Rachicladosporium monterosium TaxID=1507873 RepID=A0ABR0LH22_9PEZI|nr:hypothetical protein LTR32_000550 [Rachicladosporium monterosium]